MNFRALRLKTETEKAVGEISTKIAGDHSVIRGTAVCHRRPFGTIRVGIPTCRNDGVRRIAWLVHCRAKLDHKNIHFPQIIVLISFNGFSELSSKKTETVKRWMTRTW